MAETFKSVIRTGILKACQGSVPPRTKMHLYVVALAALGIGGVFPEWLKRKPLGRLITGVADAVAGDDLVKAGGAYRIRQIGSGIGIEEGVEAPSRKSAKRKPSPLTPANEAFGGEIVRSQR